GPNPRDHASGERRKPHRVLLRFFCGERPVLERQPVHPTAALNGVSGLHAVRECHDLLTLGATHAVGEGRGPLTALFSDAQSRPPAVGALQYISRPCSRGHPDGSVTIRATDDRHQRIPKSRCNRPRSKPTTTSSPTVMTGTASCRPVRAINSSRASVSLATFLAVNSML